MIGFFLWVISSKHRADFNFDSRLVEKKKKKTRSYNGCKTQLFTWWFLHFVVSSCRSWCHRLDTNSPVATTIELVWLKTLISCGNLASLVGYIRLYSNKGSLGPKWFNDSPKTTGREEGPWMEDMKPPSDELWTAPRGKFAMSVIANYVCLVSFFLEEREMLM